MQNNQYIRYSYKGSGSLKLQNLSIISGILKDHSFWYMVNFLSMLCIFIQDILIGLIHSDHGLILTQVLHAYRVLLVSCILEEIKLIVPDAGLRYWSGKPMTKPWGNIEDILFSVNL